MEEQKEKLSAIAQAKPYKIIISKPAGGEIPYRRIVIERELQLSPIRLVG